MRAWLLSFILAGAACSAEQHHAVRPPVTQPPPKPRVVWPRFAEVERWPVVGASFPNVGHVGAGALGVVRTNPEAHSAYEHLVRDTELPDGTVVALFHERAPGVPGPVYVMEKARGVWQFETCRPDGSDLEPDEPGRSTTVGCRRCHSEGVADDLFGVPRTASPGP